MQNEFDGEYQEALDKCFTLCIPETMSLDEIHFNKEFVGMLVFTYSITYNSGFRLERSIL